VPGRTLAARRVPTSSSAPGTRQEAASIRATKSNRYAVLTGAREEARGTSRTHESTLGLVDGDLLLGHVTGADADGLAERAVGAARRLDDSLTLLGDGEEAPLVAAAASVAGGGHGRRAVRDSGRSGG
jgi:hypothetical protein